MVSAQLLPGVIADFLVAHPGIRVTLLQAGAEECAARVLRGDLDLAIIADWRTPAGLRADPSPITR
jgi:DNA-binding transcriptional LysR family regulator